MRQIAAGNFPRIEKINRYAQSRKPGVPAAHIVAIMLDDIAVAGFEEMISVFIHQQGDLGPRRLRPREEFAVALNRRADAADRLHALGFVADGIEQAESVRLFPEALDPMIPEADARHAASQPRQHPDAQVLRRRYPPVVQRSRDGPALKFSAPKRAGPRPLLLRARSVQSIISSQISLPSAASSLLTGSSQGWPLFHLG